MSGNDGIAIPVGAHNAGKVLADGFLEESWFGGTFYTCAGQ